MIRFYSHRDEASDGHGTAALFQNTYGFERTHDPAEADIIIWNGGADIGTSIYGETPVDRRIPYEKSIRDLEEIALFDKYKDDSAKLLIGICRGSQLLNCLNGGKLYQDVNGHASGDHLMFDIRTEDVIRITSTHHQQMRPNLDTGVVLAIASESTAKNCQDGITHYERSRLLSKGQDVEVVWYPNTRTLCIQGHPEYVPGTKFSDYTLGLVKEFLPAQQAA